MSYCEGYQGDGINITGCSGYDVLFSFNARQVLLLEDSGKNTSLEKVEWPTAISDDFDAFSNTTKSMGVFYCIAAGIAAAAVLIRIALLIARRTEQMIFETPLIFVSFLILKG